VTRAILFSACTTAGTDTREQHRRKMQNCGKKATVSQKNHW
jgi:hypothetical protein